MKHFPQEWIEEWCHAHGWTDLHTERQGNYWAFPPGAVMPQPIPVSVLRAIKSAKGMSPMEKQMTYLSVSIAVSSGIMSWAWHSPMPLAVAFALVALIAAGLEPEYAY